MNEWGTGKEYDYVEFVWHVVIVFVAFVVLAWTLSGCAKPVWPDIGNGVTVEKITIRECLEGEC